MGVSKNELTVIMKAKDLCSYIMTVTQKSPKQFRFTFVSRLQNLAMDVIENIYRANEVFIGAGRDTELNLFSIFSGMAARLKIQDERKRFLCYTDCND